MVSLLQTRFPIYFGGESVRSRAQLGPTEEQKSALNSRNSEILLRETKQSADVGRAISQKNGAGFP